VLMWGFLLGEKYGKGRPRTRGWRTPTSDVLRVRYAG